MNTNPDKIDKILFVFLMIAPFSLFIPAVMAAPTASFSMYTINATDGKLWPLTTMNATKGQLIYFNASATGNTQWRWDFGDGFAESGINVTHKYTFPRYGKNLMLTNGWVKVPIVLNASDTSTSAYTTKIINLTSAMPDLVYVGAGETIAPLNESYANTFLTAIGGNTSVSSSWPGFDWLGGMGGVAAVYESSLGLTLFYILLFSIPFIMQWIISKDFVVAGIMGGIIGVWMISRLPGNMKLLAVTFIAMAIVAIIYSLLKERI